MIGRFTDEGGFTIVEVVVAMVILIVAVLGTLVLVEGSLASTSRTTAREQGTNLARDLVERSRQAGYANMTMALAPARCAPTLPASDAPAEGVPTPRSPSPAQRRPTPSTSSPARWTTRPTAPVSGRDFCAAPAATDAAGSSPTPRLRGRGQRARHPASPPPAAC